MWSVSSQRWKSLKCGRTGGSVVAHVESVHMEVFARRDVFKMVTPHDGSNIQQGTVGTRSVAGGNILDR